MAHCADKYIDEVPSQSIDFNILLIFEHANHCRSYCLLPPVFIVVPWLGGQSSGGGVVDFGLHALTALLIMLRMIMIDTPLIDYNMLMMIDIPVLDN